MCEWQAGGPLTAVSLGPAEGSLSRPSARHPPSPLGASLKGKAGLCQPGLAHAQEQHRPPAPSCKHPLPTGKFEGDAGPWRLGGPWQGVICICLCHYRGRMAAGTAPPALVPSSFHPGCLAAAERPPDRLVLPPTPLTRGAPDGPAVPEASDACGPGTGRHGRVSGVWDAAWAGAQVSCPQPRRVPTG